MNTIGSTGLTRSGVVFIALLVALGFFSLGNCGCYYRRVTDGAASYTSLSLGTNQTVAPFVLEAGQAGQPGYRKLDSKGVATDQTSGLEVAYEMGKRAGAAAALGKVIP